MISFLIFLSLTIITLIVNIALYLHRETSYSRTINKVVLIILLVSSSIFFTLNLPYFINNDSNLFLDVNIFN